MSNGNMKDCDRKEYIADSARAFASRRIGKREFLRRLGLAGVGLSSFATAMLGGNRPYPGMMSTPALADTDGSEVLTIVIGGVPAGATLSAGLNLGGGQWLLTQAQLAGLMITPPPNSDADFVLTVTATSAEGPSLGTASLGPLFLPVTVVNVPTPPPPVASALVGAGSTGTLITLADGLAPFSTVPFAGFGGELRVAQGDINGDGVLDQIFAAGPGVAGGHVKVFDGVTGALLRSFFAFEGFSGGTFVGAADVDGDGRDEVVVGADAGALPHVKVFSAPGELLMSFLAYPPSVVGGVRVAGRDVDGDGDDEIITGNGPGQRGQVTIVDRIGTINSLFVTGLDDLRGVFVG